MVDWWRYATGVVSRAADTAGETWTMLGDSNRWGSDGAVAVPLALGRYATEQLIRVQTVDPYSRNWQLIGNLSALRSFWQVSPANLSVGLEVAMGVGQATLVQTFDLRAILAVDAPWYIVPNSEEIVDVEQVWPFVISCAVIGRQLSARVVVTVKDAVILEDVTTLRVTAICSPFAAGFPI